MTINRIEGAPAEGDCARVFVPSLPTRWDPETGARKGVYDLGKAKPFGILFLLSIDAQDEHEALAAITEGMFDFQETDYILGIGDITRILAACLAAKERLDRVRLLQWDKRDQKYFITEVVF